MADAHHSLAPAVYESILGVARSLASSNDLGQVLALIINALRDLLHAERASVFQYDAATHELIATKAHGLAKDLRLSADLGIIGEAAKIKAIVDIPDAYADPRFNQAVDKATGERHEIRGEMRERCRIIGGALGVTDGRANLRGAVQSATVLTQFA